MVMVAIAAVITTVMAIITATTITTAAITTGTTDTTTATGIIGITRGIDFHRAAVPLSRRQALDGR